MDWFWIRLEHEDGREVRAKKKKNARIGEGQGLFVKRKAGIWDTRA